MQAGIKRQEESLWREQKDTEVAGWMLVHKQTHQLLSKGPSDSHCSLTFLKTKRYKDLLLASECVCVPTQPVILWSPGAFAAVEAVNEAMLDRKQHLVSSWKVKGQIMAHEVPSELQRRHGRNWTHKSLWLSHQDEQCSQCLWGGGGVGGGDRGYEDKHLHFGKPGHAAQVKLKHCLQTSRQTSIYNRLLDSYRQLLEYKNNTE